MHGNMAVRIYCRRHLKSYAGGYVGVYMGGAGNAVGDGNCLLVIGDLVRDIYIGFFTV